MKDASAQSQARRRLLTTRRAGLVLAALFSFAAMVPSLAIGPDPDSPTNIALPLVMAVLSVGITVVTLALFVPAWRGHQRSAAAVAVLQLLSIVPALPAFLLPAEALPPGSLISAAVGTTLNVVVAVLVALDCSSAVLYLSAVVLVLMLYAMLVSLLGTLIPLMPEQTLQTAVAICAALLLQPLVLALRRLVSRLIYGRREDPATMAYRISGHPAPGEEALSRALAETAAMLKLPGLELREGDRTLASVGRPADINPTVRLTETYELVATLRRGERRLHPSDHAALQLAGLSLIHLAEEARLHSELRVARTMLIHAREQERERLHRELHDGLGPLLSGAALRIDTAARSSDPEQYNQYLKLARTDLGAAIGEVRRVVAGLRPSNLEQRRLKQAILDQTKRLPSTVILPELLPELAPATEVAIYRIVGEALTNIERHSSGSHAHLVLTVDESFLRLSVRNPMSTVAEPRPANLEHGFGVASIRARVEELGGHAAIGPADGHWVVEVLLPVLATGDPDQNLRKCPQN